MEKACNTQDKKRMGEIPFMSCASTKQIFRGFLMLPDIFIVLYYLQDFRRYFTCFMKISPQSSELKSLSSEHSITCDSRIIGIIQTTYQIIFIIF